MTIEIVQESQFTKQVRAIEQELGLLLEFGKKSIIKTGMLDPQQLTAPLEVSEECKLEQRALIDCLSAKFSEMGDVMYTNESRLGHPYSPYFRNNFAKFPCLYNCEAPQMVLMFQLRTNFELFLEIVV